MAVYTKLTDSDASRVAGAHGLGACHSVQAIAAGSVNTNHFLHCDAGQFFLRIYEEQGTPGVEFEWALLDHLVTKGAVVPRRVSGPKPGEVCVAGKPTAVFHLVPGGETCQKGVTPARAFAVGRALGLCHRATEDFPIRQVSRFDTQWLAGQLAAVESRRRPELVEVTPLLRRGLEEGNASPGLVTGVIHGDLFRDNVRWEGDAIVGLLDWESASDGVLAFDVMVTVLAWCFGDTLDWKLARSLVDGYQTQRPIGSAEASTLRQWGIAAATRFSITRILSYHLRDDAVGDRVMKDYRRFVQRLELLRGMEATEVARRLTA